MTTRPNKCRFPLGGPGKPRTNPDLGSGGLGSIFIFNMIERLTEKPRRVILRHFGLITFGIHFKKTPKPIIFTVLGPGGRDHDARNQLFATLDTPKIPQKNSRNKPEPFLEMMFFGHIGINRHV